MTGKQEHTTEIKNKIEKILSGQPAYLRSFYNSMVSSGRTASYGTIWKYLQYTVIFIDTIGKPVEEVNYDDLVNWFASYEKKEDGQEKSGSYMVAVYSAIKKFYQYLENTERIQRNWMKLIDRPAPKPSDQVERTHLTIDEINMVLRKIRRRGGSRAHRDELIFALLLTTAMRCTALTEINLNDLDLENKTVTIIEKRNKQRVFELTDDVIRLAKEWLADRATWDEIPSSNQALFVSTTGRRMTQLLVSNVIENYCKVTGKHITPHKLRATCATLLEENGRSLYEIQSYLGHSSPVTTEIYLQNKNERIRKAGRTAGSFYIA